MNTKTLTDAIRERRNEELQALLRESPSLANTPDKDGEYPLHHTATYGNVEAARLLIDAGANVHAREESLHTPLSWAIVEGAHHVARLLIQNGATYDLWVSAALGDLQRVRTFFVPDGTLVPNASVHGQSRYGTDGRLLAKPP
jgi:ankyrin repeat protein